MARGGLERKYGRRRHTRAVVDQAGQLALLREKLDGMSSDDPDFDDLLGTAIATGAELAGRSTRMSRGGLSRRAACENIVTTSVTLANERNRNMSSETAPQYPSYEADRASTSRHLRVVTELAVTALTLPMDEEHPHYGDWDHHTANMPMQGV